MAQVTMEEAKNGKRLRKNILSRLLSADYVLVDFPKNGEKIFSPHYAFRVSASQNNAQVSFDGGGWKDCYSANGYHWFEWKSIPIGNHHCIARTKLSNGKSIKSGPTNFIVV